MTDEPEVGTRVRLFSSDDDARSRAEAAPAGPATPPSVSGTPPRFVTPNTPPPPVFGEPSTATRAGRRHRIRRRVRETSPRWRTTSVRSRIMALVALAVVLVALVSMTGSIAVNRVEDHSARVTALAEARRHNAVAADTLRELQLVSGVVDTPRGQIDELVRRHATAAARLESVLPSGLAVRGDVTAAATGDAAYLETVDGGVVDPGDTDLLDSALADRQELDSQLAELGATARDDLRDVRTWSIVLLVGMVLVVAVLLPALGVAIARSIVEPLRHLGRSMRRFGDGDLRARAEEAPDEVGLLARSFNLLADGAGHRIRDLSADAERGTQLRVISEALDLATDEDDVYRIVEHATAILTPGVNVEMLMSDEDSTRLRQVAVNPTASAPNCPVPDTTGCPAIRRGQAITFHRPDSLNACPWLRDRPKGPCSAVCVPAAGGGHVLGVLHATGPVDAPPGPEIVEQMITIASQASTRMGSMRTLETTRTLASTDTLTGLANRRSLESRLGDLLRTGTPFVLAVADLDHFKQVNDTYGHEFGDRALQLFANVLAENVRGHDLVARFGGEEFVLVYPGMDLQRSMEVIERIRSALARAVEAQGIPEFTCSFGITHSSVAGDVETIVRIADAGLLLAKEQGRNRVVYADADVAATVFGGPVEPGVPAPPTETRGEGERPGQSPGGPDAGRTEGAEPDLGSGDGF